jgi:hypothetical protein
MALFVLLFDFGTVPAAEQFQSPIEKTIMPHCRDSSKVQNKNRKCHTVGAPPKYNRKTNNATPPEQFQNQIEEQI